MERADELDRAGGRPVHLIYIGDPWKSGPIAQKQIGSEQFEKELESAREYITDIINAGRERCHRVRAMEALREGLPLLRTEVPCIVFPSEDATNILGTLHIKRSWRRTRAARRVFFQCLRGWLDRHELRQLARIHANRVSGSPELAILLRDLSSEIDAAVASYGRPRSTGLKINALLVIDSDSRSVYYQGIEVELPPTLFGLLKTLAETPGTKIPNETLMVRVSRHLGEFEMSPVRWAKNNKLRLMKEFRKLIGRDGIMPDQIDGLISAVHSCLRLNLAPTDVFIR